ncbi:MAG TPA: midcut-by-XrtH protein [Rudaea sp.]
MNYRWVVNRFALAPIAMLGMTSSAWAGSPGTLTYAPAAAAATTTSTPILGKWTLLLLAVLLAVIAYRVLKTRVSGRQFGLFALAGSLIAGGAASGDLIRLAHAQSIPMYPMSSATGGTVNLGLGIQQLTNTSGVPQQVTNLTVTFNGYTYINPGGSYTPQCIVGTVVAPGGSCYVDLQSPP